MSKLYSRELYFKKAVIKRNGGLKNLPFLPPSL